MKIHPIIFFKTINSIYTQNFPISRYKQIHEHYFQTFKHKPTSHKTHTPPKKPLQRDRSHHNPSHNRDAQDIDRAIRINYTRRLRKSKVIRTGFALFMLRIRTGAPWRKFARHFTVLKCQVHGKSGWKSLAMYVDVAQTGIWVKGVCGLVSYCVPNDYSEDTHWLVLPYPWCYCVMGVLGNLRNGRDCGAEWPDGFMWVLGRDLGIFQIFSINFLNDVPKIFLFLNSSWKWKKNDFKIIIWIFYTVLRFELDISQIKLKLLKICWLQIKEFSVIIDIINVHIHRNQLKK